MKERLMAFLKSNKKKIIAFVLAGVVATVGVTATPETIESASQFISGLF
jgi:hypothetical protein